MIGILIFCFISKCEIINNELYVKLLSERIYFNISKHQAIKPVIEEYKHVKKNSHEKIRLLDEGNDYILYANSSDVLHIIYMKEGKVLAPGENNHFEPSENRQFQPNKKSHCHNS